METDTEPSKGRRTAEDLHAAMEEWCVSHDGDIADFFTDGSIYGEDSEGNWIVGYGVCGSMDIVVCPDCVKAGGFRSGDFSPELASAVADLRNLLGNC